MVSPHLLKVRESFSTSHRDYQYASIAKLAPHNLLGWEDTPIYIIESKSKEPKWCHMVLALGPVLGDEEATGSELVIIWWSEMGPDTERVLSAIDWEKHAKNYT